MQRWLNLLDRFIYHTKQENVGVKNELNIECHFMYIIALEYERYEAIKSQGRMFYFVI